MPNHILDLKSQPWWKMGMIPLQIHTYLGHSMNLALTNALVDETNLKPAFLAYKLLLLLGSTCLSVSPTGPHD